MLNNFCAKFGIRLKFSEKDLHMKWD